MDEYDNTKKRVVSLRRLHMLDEVKKRSKHRSRSYKLSNIGVYHIILTNEFLSGRLLKALLRNYSHNILLELFLYPYVGKYALSEITDSLLLSHISSYLHDCCKCLEDAFYIIKNVKSGYSTQEIFLWQNIPENIYDIISYVNF